MKLPEVVVLGAGFAGLSCVRKLRGLPLKITLIDKTNHHLFQPLLYQVATAGLSPAQIAYPIRSLLRRQKNVEVWMDLVTGIDTAAKTVFLEKHQIKYDYLVVATGSETSYFNHSEWEAVAPGLKTIPDATSLRQKILLAFEQAEIETDPKEQAALLHFVLVGGGPTGVEMAGAVSELAFHTLKKDFRRADPKTARITLIEAGPRILSTFPPELSQDAVRRLDKLGVQIRAGEPVTQIDAAGVHTSKETYHSRNVIWTAGVKASAAGQWLKAPVDRAGRVKVEPNLSLPGHPEVFVLGDTAYLEQNGKPLPGVAPVAMQQGRYVGETLKARIQGKPPKKAFVYADKGNLATIGRAAAIADLGWLQLKGLPGWLAWTAVHIFYLIGFKNRLLVLLEWTWAYVTFQRGARLITGFRRSS